MNLDPTGISPFKESKRVPVLKHNQNPYSCFLTSHALVEFLLKLTSTSTDFGNRWVVPKRIKATATQKGSLTEMRPVSQRKCKNNDPPDSIICRKIFPNYLYAAKSLFGGGYHQSADSSPFSSSLFAET